MTEILSTQVRYNVRFPAPRTNYVSVEAILPVAGQASIEVFLPVWTPGSYLVREYARNVDSVSAIDGAGKSLRVEKSRKNRWRISTGGAAEVHFRYQVYCHEMSVRSNWVEEDFALLNGAPTFVTLVGGLKLEHDVKLELPSGWATSVTGLPEAKDGAPHHYTAPDYDTLVDSPILAGNPAVYKFEVDGIPHLLVNEGEGGVWDGPKSAADVEKIVRRYRAMWGSLPYKKYVFLNLMTAGVEGGLEHKNSVCMMTTRWATRTRKAYSSWLSLASHEFFHAWNVKRLRPVELGPFDYENENHTQGLWIAEGFTDYYGDLTVKRAGLIEDAEYLGGPLSEAVHTLQSTPGRLLQPAQLSSYDAWIKFYRPDENSLNTSISYYTKGSVIAWLLDAKIRKATSGAKSLDTLMRAAFDQFSGAKGYTQAEFFATAEAVSGVPLRDFFHRAVETTEELDYSEALDWFGLRWKVPETPKAPGAKAKKASLGAITRIDNGRLIVSKIPRGTSAADSGLNVEDEILAIDDYRVRSEALAERLEQYNPGDQVTLLVSRRERILRMDFKLDTEPVKWELELLPNATAAQKANLAAWLK